MPEICKLEQKLYRVVRVENELYVAGHYEVYHQNLIQQYWGVQMWDVDEIKTRLHKDPKRNRIDMTTLWRVGNDIEVSGRSTKLEWPPQELLLELRSVTIKLLQVNYPDYNFID